MSDLPQTVKDLKPSEYNPRVMSEKQHEALAESMDRFGDLSGIVFNRRTGRLVGAHQRRSHIPDDAPIELHGNRKKKPNKQGTLATGFIRVGDEKWQYREVDVPEETEAAMNVAANKHRGDWHYGLLIDTLQDLASTEIPNTAIGFTSAELDALLAPIELPEGESDGTEWDGMPECENEDKGPYRSIIMHFFDQEGLDSFAKLVNHKFTDKTKYAWFPQIVIERAFDKRYADESA